jgi:uncharacterized C2H2 Zn-finger protein
MNAFLCLLDIGSHQGYGFSRGYVRFLDVLIHGTSIGENSITMNTRKFLAIMQTFTMRLKVGFASKSLFGHRKEKHSGVMEVHTCPECGKTFGRKSNLKAHRESLHYGKKFPCVHCDRIFTNRSSMNQHIKKTHIATAETISLMAANVQ